MKKYSFNPFHLIEPQKEFFLSLVNCANFKFFIDFKREIRRKQRVISIKIFKDRHDAIQEKIFPALDIMEELTIESYSIPAGGATVKFSANFDFSIKDLSYDPDNKCIQIVICQAES